MRLDTSDQFPDESFKKHGLYRNPDWGMQITLQIAISPRPTRTILRLISRLTFVNFFPPSCSLPPFSPLEPGGLGWR